MIDDFRRECLAIEVGTSLRGLVVTRVLERVATQRGCPAVIVTDNEPELRGREMDAWAFRHGIRRHFIDPGKPMQNGFVESFSDKFRYECLNAEWFGGIDDARRAAALQAPPALSGLLRHGSAPAAEALGFVTSTSDQKKGAGQHARRKVCTAVERRNA